MDGQARSVGELLEERGGEIGAQPSCARRRQIGVRGDERPAGRLDDDQRQRLVRRSDAEPAPGIVGFEERTQGVAESSPGEADLRLRLVGCDLEREPEAGGDGELLEKVIENGDACLDLALGSRRVDASGARRGHSSVRSIDAPRSRRRSSIRSYPRSI